MLCPLRCVALPSRGEDSGFVLEGDGLCPTADLAARTAERRMFEDE